MALARFVPSRSQLNSKWVCTRLVPSLPQALMVTKTLPNRPFIAAQIRWSVQVESNLRIQKVETEISKVNA